MKHLLNNLSNEEKNSIRKQHNGGMSVDTSRFKQLMESTLGDVKPLISEQNEPSFIQKIKNAYRNVFEGGDIDYNYIENSMTTKELADLIYASLQKSHSLAVLIQQEFGKKMVPKDYSAPEFITDGNAEAPVEAAFLNMSKPLKKEGNCPECWKKYNEVVTLYKQRFNGDMMEDVKDSIDIYRKWHKKPINNIIKSWGSELD